MTQPTKYNDVVDYISSCDSEHALKYFQHLVKSRLEILELQKLVDNCSTKED